MQNITVINHDIRLQLGLSCNEYCIIDFFHQDFKTANQMPRDEFAARYGLCKQSVLGIIKHLCKSGLMQQHGRDYSTTEKWASLFDYRPEKNTVRPAWQPKKTISVKEVA